MPQDYKSLTSEEAEKRLKQFGPNTLPEKPPPSSFSIFLAQLKSPLIYVLIFAGVATLFLKDYQDSAIIFLAVLVNALLGFVQEQKATKALASLKKLVTREVEVIRDGRRVMVSVETIVPGDVVYLHQGTKIPADGILQFANRLYVDEAILTGESIAVAKSAVSGEKEPTDSDRVSMGTLVASGQGVMVVESIGASTRIGKIALEIQEPRENTPLQQQLVRFSKQLVILVVVLTVSVFLIGLISGREVVEMFSVSVALAVSAIPEGLLIALTVVLAIGMQRILKRKGLVRKLISAETLGGVTTICLDKTGTLTRGQLEVVEVLGNENDVVSQMILANDLDDPIVIAGHNWAVKKSSEKQMKDITSQHERIDSIPFSAKERYFASLNKWDDSHNMLFVNGAPDYLLDWTTLNNNEKKKVLASIEELTSQGRRLVGLARKVVSKNVRTVSPKLVKSHLEWVGLMSFTDPVRPDVSSALENAQRAGIKLVVITGDYPKTAMAVMRELNIPTTEDMVMTGEMLARLSDSALARSIQKVKLFARTTPHQKLEIVEAMKLNGEVVAMMGDGVNDAPALRKADIGIVVGDATDVAKESADLILLDSKFQTVVGAIEEGRGIYDNIRKIIVYLMSSAFNEITAVVGAIILGLPLPVTAAQILWINLVSDGLPYISLTLDPKRKNVMSEPPRSPSEQLVAGWMRVIIIIVSFTSGCIALGLFAYVYHTTQNREIAQSVAFVSLGINSLIYVFSVRTLLQPFWKEGLLTNKWLLYAIFGGIFLQVAPFLSLRMRQFFGLVQLPPVYWLAVVGTGIITFIAIEIIKTFYRTKYVT